MDKLLDDDQLEAVNKIKNGCILNGGTGSGKSRCGLYYYAKNYLDKPLYIITTAKKRDSGEWRKEIETIEVGLNVSIDPFKLVIDSWNNIKKYRKEFGAFFIFDEDKVTGSGVWVKSFLDISRKNQWIILSATPGDCWMDYWAVFVANGFYKNKTDFVNVHVIYKRFSNYPQVQGYFNTKILEKYRDQILIPIHFEKNTVQHHIVMPCMYDRSAYKDLVRTRWNPYTNKPIENASELCYLCRKLTNSDPSRLNILLNILTDKRKIIVFYSFDYELDLLLSVDFGVEVRQWNGHKHDNLPKGEAWVYLVQYTAGAEGWNCITTDTIVFFSQQYSYKVFEQSCGRIDRRNTPYTDLYYYHLRSSSPIDIAISLAIKNKKDFNERRYIKL